jgi:hypothetical protein
MDTPTLYDIHRNSKLTQAEVSERMAAHDGKKPRHQTSISKILERGTQKYTTLQALAIAYGIDLEEIVAANAQTMRFGVPQDSTPLDSGRPRKNYDNLPILT